MRRKKSERDEKTFFQQIFKFMSNHAAAVQNLVAFSGILLVLARVKKGIFSTSTRYRINQQPHRTGSTIKRPAKKHQKSPIDL